MILEVFVSEILCLVILSINKYKQLLKIPFRFFFTLAKLNKHKTATLNL